MGSAILSADDLNDFISPGVACIKPVETLPALPESNPYEVTTEDKIAAQNPAPASISLTDCLACSGCVTSAEAVLISLQSHNEVLHTLDTHPSIDVSALLDRDKSYQPPADARIFVASVSPQVRASIAATFGISSRRAGNLIEQFLSGTQGLQTGGKHSSRFSYVLDTNRMREACLALAAEEVAQVLADRSRSKPIITSACPGWICYAEKTHPHILPHLSALKSPQALTGTLIKSVLSKKLNLHPSQIWHLAIMPCFDKKLEASREELTDRSWYSTRGANDEAVRDVDCVITSRELLSLATARGITLSTVLTAPLPRAQRSPLPDPIISSFLLRRRTPSQTPDYSTSGGYLRHILSHTASLHPGSTIATQRGRNNDVTDYTLLSFTGEPILKCARHYGFRNIQNLVRKLKPAKSSAMPGAATRKSRVGGPNSGSEYAYVEVMACPGGCTNGGGQIKLEDVVETIPLTRHEQVDEGISIPNPVGQKEWLARVDEAYFSADTDASTVEDDGDTRSLDTSLSYRSNGNTHTGDNNITVDEFLRHWANLVDVSIDKLVYTTYRKVESDVGKTKKEVKGMNDGARIAAIAGLEGGGW